MARRGPCLDQSTSGLCDATSYLPGSCLDQSTTVLCDVTSYRPGPCQDQSTSGLCDVTSYRHAKCLTDWRGRVSRLQGHVTSQRPAHDMFRCLGTTVGLVINVSCNVNNCPFL
ncbi:hypothetical protein DPMN_166312 [Dreissena polymorpha]|uniref:Uncharacterized protein n=1 Tax=Dreissena polymorpha TaxID=45954 RepID=A0A9D4IXA0_DREPO|nr:hypothetical protein DPMN_166312 [Dreissena polymorpha]